MELNRNQFFLLGLVILFLGVEFRLIESFVLNEKATKFIMERTKKSDGIGSLSAYLPAMGTAPKRTVRPPNWIGWALVSIGAVLVLHSLAMNKPEGG
jgi:hypothetical protein